jgi:hypothetical protein
VSVGIDTAGSYAVGELIAYKWTVPPKKTEPLEALVSLVGGASADRIYALMENNGATGTITISGVEIT